MASLVSLGRANGGGLVIRFSRMQELSYPHRPEAYADSRASVELAPRWREYRDSTFWRTNLDGLLQAEPDHQGVFEHRWTEVTAQAYRMKSDGTIVKGRVL